MLQYLGDYLDYFCTIAAANVSMLSYMPHFPGLVYFILIDRRYP